MAKFLLAVLLLPLTFYGQQTGGLKFEEKLSWEEVLTKARVEGKLIFVDCYATWCIPCKRMDEAVYTSQNVGDLFNRHFISIKIQMDSTENDSQEVKKWFKKAQEFSGRYQIAGYPTFLFFNANGGAIHKAAGYKDTGAFLALGKDVLNPEKQYFSLLQSFKGSTIKDSLMPYLANSAQDMGDVQTANLVARYYKEKILDSIFLKNQYSRPLFEFLSAFPHLLHSSDSIFKFMYAHQRAVDSFVQFEGYSYNFIRHVITGEEVRVKTYSNDKPVDKPNWNAIRQSIAKKYNEDYAEEIVVSEQIDFFRRKNDWKKFAFYYNQAILLVPPAVQGQRFKTIVRGPLNDAWALNAAAWDVFQNCNERPVLKNALKWVELGLKLEPADNPHGSIQFLDTRANLLYKLGRAKDAIHAESVAIDADSIEARKRGEPKGGFFDEFTETLRKMKAGEPTWPDAQM